MSATAARVKAAALVLALLPCSVPVAADPAVPCVSPLFDVAALPAGLPGTGDETNISADGTRTDSDGNAVFEGDVIITQRGRSIASDTAIYDRGSEAFTLDGHIRLNNDSLQLTATSGYFDSRDNQGSFEGVSYLLHASQLRGQATRLETGSAQATVTTLHDTAITSCPPGKPDWLLQAERIEIDHDEQYGKADDVMLEFMGVPFFYTPYMEFPVGDRRRSGLLAPEWSNSDARGFELVVPWYWNIAPNHDAIIAPHPMRKRGLQLDTEYRFLTSTTRGEINSAWLHEDDITGTERYYTVYTQKSSLPAGMKLDINVHDVSDVEYFEDFSNSLADTSQTHLNRSASLTHDSESWRSSLLVQSFETVDGAVGVADRPYRKLPQLFTEGRYRFEDSALRLRLTATWTEFDHESSTQTTGSRLSFTPEVSLPLQGAAWYLKPVVQMSHTSYDVADNSGDIELADRNVLISSLDTGLFFERRFGDGLVQTLEPRLYYLKTPYRDQSLYPVFDTNVPTFSFTQLFRNNRFNGGDRIGDANQLTAALSSRIISGDDGSEFLRASIGQVIYFDDRRVNLDNSIDTDDQSDLIAEIGGQRGDWYARASWQWDNSTRESERQNYLLRYQSDPGRVINITYRQQDNIIPADVIEQSDVSFVTPVSEVVTLYGRWKYSYTDNSDINVIGGIGYESCCWSLRVLAQRNRINDTANEYDNSIQLQLVLKGLGSVSGSRLDNTLSNAIPGYQDEDI